MTAPARPASAFLALAALLLCATTAAAAGDDVPESAVVATVPFLDVPGSHYVHIDLAVAGDPPLPLLLDTGARFTVASTSAAARIEGGRLVEGGGPVEGSDVIVRDTRLGKRVQIIASENLEDPTVAPEADWVRLGTDFLKQFVVELDFAGRRVRFIDPRRYQVPEQPSDPKAGVAALGTQAKMRTVIGLGERKLDVALDTGIATPITLGVRALRRAGIESHHLPSLRGDVRGPRNKAHLLETDEITVGSLELGPCPVLVTGTGVEDSYGGSGSAVGLDVLSRFTLRFDAASNRVWLKPSTMRPMTFLGIDYAYTRDSGAFLSATRGRYLVVGVLPGSPAERLGLLAWDRLDPRVLGMDTPLALLNAIRAESVMVVERYTQEDWQDVVLPQAPVAAEGETQVATP